MSNWSMPGRLTPDPHFTAGTCPSCGSTNRTLSYSRVSPPGHHETTWLYYTCNGCAAKTIFDQATGKILSPGRDIHSDAWNQMVDGGAWVPPHLHPEDFE
jgi:hypothetical protein